MSLFEYKHYTNYILRTKSIRYSAHPKSHIDDVFVICKSSTAISEISDAQHWINTKKSVESPGEFSKISCGDELGFLLP